MITLSFSVWGDELIQRDLLRFESRAVNMAPAFAALAEDFSDWTREQFESEGGRASGGWTPLKPETILAKENAGYATAILHRTLLLRDSLIDIQHPDHTAVITPESLTWGSEVEYGKYHQTGAPRANVPQRRPIEFTEMDKALAMKTLQRYMVEGDLSGAAI